MNQLGNCQGLKNRSSWGDIEEGHFGWQWNEIGGKLAPYQEA